MGPESTTSVTGAAFTDSRGTPVWPPLFVNDPSVVYHYTDRGGFLGILTTRTLWAASIRHLNDSQELSLVHGAFTGALSEALQEANNVTRSLLLAAPERLGDFGGENVGAYTVSFSTLPDDLSQWRGYSGEEGGFALGFATSELGRLGSVQTLFGPCIYGAPAAHQHARDIVNKCLTWAVGTADPTAQFISCLRLNRMLHGPFFKDEKFSAEREWRLVSYRQDGLKYRGRRSMIVPYVEIDISPGNDSRNPQFRLLLRDVVVGPGPHADLDAFAADRAVLAAGYHMSKEARKSGIPYRNW